MFKVFLLVGTNLGDRHDYLQRAIGQIGQLIGPIITLSSVYETQAWGKTDQPDYLNQVVIAQTNLQPHEVLKRILQIELDLGRKREEKWGARTIDIDILFYDEIVLNDPDLIIPHPQLQNRRFTLEPLAEVAPELIHPVLKQNMLYLKNNLQDCLIVKKL
ncbi:2-amino-4-hydroxy-6-hydroxymethyldihydropteridine diphosphokinase [Mucilaginibacter boryungensis]|uniref:2-amino-4-hydroxy-6-hydroxymethyldihydropteridine pyrophosphokinase n=1 Tax=Mucilaginibacter boryungensis TaxID=768480 RepID=A0ABR9XI19_9SPHI|nr:2-amino-4-hydroxy-6-hydroxymethyldihydropteridine diphosphokinase [Mucilaginibacter boryungensis]MBE9666664.1 2-amino-4-hydroxy-6-hydroxymethyldihydropteridine diphosphokinase [Mucilaginibacter boryungensis]